MWIRRFCVLSSIQRTLTYNWNIHSGSCSLVGDRDCFLCNCSKIKDNFQGENMCSCGMQRMYISFSGVYFCYMPQISKPVPGIIHTHRINIFEVVRSVTLTQINAPGGKLQAVCMGTFQIISCSIGVVTEPCLASRFFD